MIGHVTDKHSHERLPFITISLKGTTIGTTTDETGHYFLKNLPEGTFTVEVSSVGYKTVRKEINFKKGKTIEMNLTSFHWKVFWCLQTETKLTAVWHLHWLM